MKESLKAVAWGVLWGVFILLLTSLPGKFLPRIPQFFDLFRPDKLVHVFVFTVFVFLWIRGLRRVPQPFFHSNALLLSMNLGIFLGGITEILQQWLIPNRVGSVYDFITNVAGCFLGWGLYRYLEKKHRYSQ